MSGCQCPYVMRCQVFSVYIWWDVRLSVYTCNEMSGCQCPHVMWWDVRLPMSTCDEMSGCQCPHVTRCQVVSVHMWWDVRLSVSTCDEMSGCQCPHVMRWDVSDQAVCGPDQGGWSLKPVPGSGASPGRHQSSVLSPGSHRSRSLAILVIEWPSARQHLAHLARW